MSSVRDESGSSFDALGSDGDVVPAAVTDAGCERELNEDRYAVIESPSGVAWIVCDGMGGEAGGELAAQLALDAMRRDLENLAGRPSSEALKGAIQEANRIIVLRRQNASFAQMGTTIVAVLFAAPEVAVAHVGDSRAYLISDGTIKQLTTDHTYVQELVERGHIKKEEALSHPDAHILTRCIGAEPALRIDISKHWLWPLEEGERQDSIVLCTDGLYSQVTEQELLDAVSEHAPQRACVMLVEKAKVRGGFDNMTLAVIPLGGKLKSSPPEGYDASKAVRRGPGKRIDSSAGTAERSIARDLIVLITLIVLAVLLTTVLFFLVMGHG